MQLSRMRRIQRRMHRSNASHRFAEYIHTKTITIVSVTVKRDSGYFMMQRSRSCHLCISASFRVRVINLQRITYVGSTNTSEQRPFYRHRQRYRQTLDTCIPAIQSSPAQYKLQLSTLSVTFHKSFLSLWQNSRTLSPTFFQPTRTV